MVTKEKEAALDRMLLEHEVERFFTYESSLLDERLWDEWLELLTEDIRYYMPIMRNVKYGEQERELTQERGGINYFDEGKDILAKRLQQIQTGIHWAEEPLSRIVHMVTNVQITDVSEDEGEIRTKCSFLTYRNRVETETDFFVGRRRDTLRRVDGALKVCRREVYLAQNVLLAKNITLLF